MDDRKSLAILDSIFYSQSAVNSAMRGIDIENSVGHLFTKAGRESEVEREVALPINSLVASAFEIALNDYGYSIVPTPVTTSSEEN